MTKFKLNGKEIIAQKNETIWQAAKNNNVEIPHLCHADQVGYDLMVIVEHASYKLTMRELLLHLV